MRSLLMAGTAGLFLTIGAASAYADSVFRPAIDAIGNAEPPAIESSPGIPDGVDFGYQGVPAGRGKVTVDSATMPPANSHLAHRKIWAITR
jgi:hypothetical protein